MLEEKSELYVYIDETGSLSENDPASDFYISAAVFIKDKDVLNISQELNKICQELGNGGILKSSRIRTHHELRLQYLERIAKLNFSYVFLITDKNKINTDSGLKYKKSRYKFIHRKLNEYLSQIFSSMQIVIDTHGTKDFQNECLRYYQKQNATLFSSTKIVYTDDTQEPLLQLADFIAGTLSYCFEPKKKSNFSNKFRSILKSKEAGYDFFPRGHIELPTQEVSTTMTFEHELETVLYNKANNLLSILERQNDSKSKMQYYTLDRLFMASVYEDLEHKSIYADQIIAELKLQGFSTDRVHFMKEIIGGLRFSGIIIAGSINGYKLALSLKDIHDYLTHDKNIILPMLNKLKLAKTNILTLINYNILSDGFSNLDALVEALGNKNLEDYINEPDIENIKFLEDNTNGKP